jgi:hypothetical protein
MEAADGRSGDWRRRRDGGDAERSLGTGEGDLRADRHELNQYMEALRCIAGPPPTFFSCWPRQHLVTPSHHRLHSCRRRQ